MKTAACFAVFLASLFASSARAEEAATVLPKLECKSCRTYPMSFILGSQMFRGGTSSGGQVLRVDGFVGLMFTWRPWLVIGVSTHVGRTWFTYASANVAADKAAPKSTDPMTYAKFDLSTQAYVTIEPTVQGRLFEINLPRIRSRLSLWVYGVFETQLNLGDDLNINTASLETFANGMTTSTDLTPLIHEDSNRLRMHYQFNRYELGAFVRLEWQQSGRDRLNIEMSAAWQRLDSQVTILVNQETRDIATAVGLDPAKIEGSFSLRNDAPVFLPKLSVRTVNNFWVTVSGAAAPVGGKVFVAARLTLEYRLNP